ncbi:MAG TPA: PPK2 family polyphosphate kinase [Thermoanaerobaculia bacterium]
MARAMVFDKAGAKVRLDKIDTAPPKKLDKEEARRRFEELDQELFDLQDLLCGAKRRGVLIVLQGRDAAGKDGTIKHVAGALNPRGVSVSSFAAPSTEERQHDFLWRVHKRTPRIGEVAIFNRSHYEDVLVVRVHRLVKRKTWKGRYDLINAFEQLLADEGCIVLKYFLHISKGEQEKRLLAREDDSKNAWKLSLDDWKDRELWDEFTEAYEDVISRCASSQAPWTVVPADAKWYRNLVVAESIAAALKPYRKEWQETLKQEGKRRRAALEGWRADRSAKSHSADRRSRSAGMDSDGPDRTGLATP